MALSFLEDEAATAQADLAARGMSFLTVINGDQVAKNLFCGQYWDMRSQGSLFRNPAETTAGFVAPRKQLSFYQYFAT
jgi:hypothetical protein